MAEKFNQDPLPLSDLPSGPSSFDSFLEKNQKGLTVAALVLILAGAGWMGQRAIKSSRNDTAAKELAVAKTPEQLKQVADKRANTPAGPSASILLAEDQWKSGKQDESIQTLRSLISASPEHPVIPTAKASLGAKLMQQGKKDEAVSLFQQLTGDPKATYIAPYALICLGDLAKADGKTDEASKFYTQAKNNYGATNPFNQVADQHLELLKFKLPTEIDAPPTPTVPEPGSPEAVPPTPGLQGNPLINNFQPAPGPEETPAPGFPAPPAPEPAPADPGKSN